MNGRNLFESRSKYAFRTRKAREDPQPGVFISHSKLDRDKAREIAETLRLLRIDYYLDEEDKELQIADKKKQHLIVVQRIEAGVKACTHLLGIITGHTTGSWWVPYEIGSATGHGCACAHVIDAKVNVLPSYIQAATIIPDRPALRAWLPMPKRSPSRFITEFNEIMESASHYPDFLPEERSVDALTFEPSLP